MKALVKWAVFCTATGRRPRYDLDTRRYFDIADRDRPGLRATSSASTARSPTRTSRSSGTPTSAPAGSAHLDDVVLEWVDGPDFDRLLVDTVRSTFPAHEHDHFIAHYRGLLAAWANDERARLGSMT